MAGAVVAIDSVNAVAAHVGARAATRRGVDETIDMDPLCNQTHEPCREVD
jgi:hypothetical protein